MLQSLLSSLPISLEEASLRPDHMAALVATANITADTRLVDKAWEGLPALREFVVSQCK